MTTFYSYAAAPAGPPPESPEAMIIKHPAVTGMFDFMKRDADNADMLGTMD